MTEPPRHPLRALLVAQFLGAFNANAWKLIVTLLAIATATVGLSGAEAEAAAHHETSLAFVVFLLPMLIVSLPAGAIADRVSKRTVILGTKVLVVVQSPLRDSRNIQPCAVRGDFSRFLTSRRADLPRPDGVAIDVVLAKEAIGIAQSRLTRKDARRIPAYVHT